MPKPTVINEYRKHTTLGRKFPNRKKNITYKQKKFALAYVRNNGNATKAALEAYDSNYENAKVVGYQNLQKPLVQEEIKRIEQVLVDKGMTLEWLAQKSQETIVNGMGVKATQKDASDMIKFMYKLHNALPVNKKMSMNISVRGKLASDDVSSVVDTVKSLSVKSNELIKDLTS